MSLVIARSTELRLMLWAIFSAPALPTRVDVATELTARAVVEETGVPGFAPSL